MRNGVLLLLLASCRTSLLFPITAHLNVVVVLGSCAGGRRRQLHGSGRRRRDAVAAADGAGSGPAVAEGRRDHGRVQRWDPGRGAAGGGGDMHRGLLPAGPTELYRLAKEVGKLVTQLRQTATEASSAFSETMEQQLALSEIQSASRELQDAFSNP